MTLALLLGKSSPQSVSVVLMRRINSTATARSRNAPFLSLVQMLKYLPMLFNERERVLTSHVGWKRGSGDGHGGEQ